MQIDKQQKRRMNSSYAVNAMQWAVANGIVNGSNGKLNPKNNAIRAEVAAILMRFCEMSK